MTDTPKPPMVIYGRRLHPSTDLDGNIISENWMASTSDHPLMKGETYVHLDQFIEEVGRRANSGNDTGYWATTYAGLLAIAQELDK